MSVTTDVSLSGTARAPESVIQELRYEVSVNGGPYGPPVPIVVSPHDAGESVAWSVVIPDLGAASYSARVTAVAADSGGAVVVRGFEVVVAS